MMNAWGYSMIGLALVAVVIARGVPRAWLWIGMGMLSFLASGLYWDFAKYQASDIYRQLHPIFTFACDSLVCVVLHKKAEERWELGIFAVFILSVFVSLLRIGIFIQDNMLYAQFLEFFSAAALLIVGCTGLMERLGRHEDRVFHHINRYLHSSFDPRRRSRRQDHV